MSTRPVEPVTDWLPTTPRRHLSVARTNASGFSTTDALDLAFTGQPCEFLRANGTSTTMAVNRWTRDASPTDLFLFINDCVGPTLDVGCGPGRLAGALAARGVQALGIDISSEAVRLARGRGAAALCRDVFSDLPGSRAWRSVLLADGNIGLGGDPLRLLRRVAALLAPDGSALVELRSPGVGVVLEHARLRVGRETSPTFGWATVGVDAIHDLARCSALRVTQIRQRSGSFVATLQHDPYGQVARARSTWN